MKFKSVKTPAEIALVGVTVELTMEDAAIRGVTIRDGEGHVMFVKKSSSYSEDIKILIPAPPETEKRYFVTGKFMGLASVDEMFTDKYGAEKRLREYDNTATSGSSGLKVEERDVLVDETPKPAAESDEVPF